MKDNFKLLKINKNVLNFFNNERVKIRLKSLKFQS